MCRPGNRTQNGTTIKPGPARYHTSYSASIVGDVGWQPRLCLVRSGQLLLPLVRSDQLVSRNAAERAIPIGNEPSAASIGCRAGLTFLHKYLLIAVDQRAGRQSGGLRLKPSTVYQVSEPEHRCRTTSVAMSFGSTPRAYHCQLVNQSALRLHLGIQHQLMPGKRAWSGCSSSCSLACDRPRECCSASTRALRAAT